MSHETSAGLPSGDRDPLSPPPPIGHFSLDRWQVLQLVKDTARALGLGERDIAVLAAHLSVLPKGPVQSDRLCMSYAEIGGLLDRANCMDERRFRRGETRLAEAGLILRKLSGNGRRYPVRDGRGQIVDAYGIDLRPLFLRVPELRQLRDDLAQAEARRRAVRSRLSARLGALRRGLGDALPQTVQEIMGELQRLCRRSSARIAELQAAERRMDEIEAAISEAPECRDSQPSPDIPAADAGQTVRRMESPEKEIHTPHDPQALLRASPRVAGYFPETPRNAQALKRSIQDFIGFLGLDRDRGRQITDTVPLSDLLQMLEYLMGRLSAIRDPAGYLLTIIARYQTGNPVAGGQVRRRCHAL
ncbi:helix-turn-helix domain-containing protein [Mangrovicoccus algicola]|uniref:Plasmid replication protein C N-terminal domain-containing protein n=1 Tax=Mangrovicoccus algicola TaxID=2771008 RepID=A0A8J6ZA32_9RHOB|nr:helix-turn-helix domain-containing protein [Mangrovicoccus algicola]MBE3638876.1 hypothetical protein [Mangrovicoccus algicola]